MKKTKVPQQLWKRAVLMLTLSLAIVALLGLAVYKLYLPESHLCTSAQSRLDEWHADKKKYADRGVITDPAGPITSEEEQKLCNLPAF